MSRSTASPVPGADASTLERPALLERAVEDMARRRRAGEQPIAEEYFQRYPELAQELDVALELIAEEMSLRQEVGEEPTATEYARRFPQWRRQVAALADCQRLLAAECRRPRFPAAGETVGAFRLLAEIGRGAHGRVFLATQPAHADRPVVLKLTAGGSREHLSLSRLQHTHIVPLYSFHDFPARGLRGLCQPYFGGLTLAALFDALAAVPLAQRTGRDVLGALETAQAPVPIPLAVQGPACQFLARASYVQVVCWLGACLADALQYAHERGLLHLDLKPSNVLLAADGQPMLLDFDLARSCLGAGDPAPERLGGTPGYMAPEHEAAMTAVSEGRTLPTAVDGRADVYALGLLLSALLGIDASAKRKPLASVGLADLLARCVAADPTDRYPTAGDLAGDLRRHLADQPLRGVANRSLPERWRKWRRRRPFVLPLYGLLLATALTGGGWFWHVNRQLTAAEEALHRGEEQLLQRHYVEAMHLFHSGAALADDVPFACELRRALAEGAQRAKQGQAAAELHELCERVRGAYDVDELTADQARELEAHCADLWQQRERITEQLSRQSAPGLDEQVADDLLDLAIVLANLRARLSSEGGSDAALAILDEAVQLCGPRQVLAVEGGAHGRAPGAANSRAARAAWEHYALGRAYLRAGNLDTAAAELDRALECEPQSFWANFTSGVCASRRGRPADALASFSACAALLPHSAACFYNRGRAYAELGRLDAARRDLEHALALDPHHEPARELLGRLAPPQ